MKNTNTSTVAEVIDVTPETTAIATFQNDDTSFVGQLTTRTAQYCSIKPKTDAEKVVMFKAMNNPEKRLGDCINKTIMLKDLFCETVTLLNEKTGELQDCPRIVLIDDKGVGYGTVSFGVFSALKKLIGVFGQPTWTTPLKVVVLQKAKGDHKFLTLDLE